VGSSRMHPELFDCVNQKLRRVFVLAQSLEASLPLRREQTTLAHQHSVQETVIQGRNGSLPYLYIAAESAERPLSPRAALQEGGEVGGFCER
jgi:hypothetical protein